MWLKETNLRIINMDISDRQTDRGTGSPKKQTRAHASSEADVIQYW
jgi:hypothetical protein